VERSQDATSTRILISNVQAGQVYIGEQLSGCGIDGGLASQDLGDNPFRYLQGLFSLGWREQGKTPAEFKNLLLS
jgi:hypothetical protein